jgi:hypothetical protein
MTQQIECRIMITLLALANGIKEKSIVATALVCIVSHQGQTDQCRQQKQYVFQPLHFTPV